VGSRKQGVSCAELVAMEIIVSKSNGNNRVSCCVVVLNIQQFSRDAETEITKEREIHSFIVEDRLRLAITHVIYDKLYNMRNHYDN
jgi:hypothetical protein